MPPRRKPVIVNGEEHWHCSKCKEAKAPDCFYVHKPSLSGLSSWCTTCQSRDKARSNSLIPVIIRNRKNGREWESRNSEKRREYIRRARIKYHKLRNAGVPRKKRDPIQERARSALSYGIKKGRIMPPSNCEVCGSTRRLYGHHDCYDQDRWLVVTWMCCKCHTWTHARRRDQAKGLWI